MHGELFDTCEERKRHGVATHSIAVQLLDFQPLLLDTPDERAEHASGVQAPATVPNGRICTFMDEPTRLQTLLTQARPYGRGMITDKVHICMPRLAAAFSCRTVLLIAHANWRKEGRRSHQCCVPHVR